MDFSWYNNHWTGLFLGSLLMVMPVGYFKIDGVILIFIQWLLKQFMLGC